MTRKGHGSRSGQQFSTSIGNYRPGKPHPSEPRAADTYRGARRNAYRGMIWPGCATARLRMPYRLLNRKWNDGATTYEQARRNADRRRPDLDLGPVR